MKKLFLKSLFLVGFSLSTLYGINNIEYLIDHDFIEKNKEDLSKEISCEFNTLPKPTGTYQIGVKIYDLIDENRDNILIPIWIFFPIEKGPQTLSPKVSEKRALDLFNTIDIWDELNVSVHSRIIDNLDFLKNAGNHPVVFFNHGNGMLCSDNAFLLEDLASHGYVVISIQNQLNTDKLELAKFTKGTFENYNKVIRNNLFVFDWLTNNNNAIFYNSLDLSRIGVIGYSMGANSLMLWSDKASRDSTKNHFLFPHDTSNSKECIVALDARRIAFPFINNTPIFMLISSEREEEQQINGECELMKKVGHQFQYYKNTHHGSFSDHAYFNIDCPLAPKQGWHYGSTEERVQFFDNIRKDIREFLEEKIGKYSDCKKKIKDLSLPASISKTNFNRIIELAEKGCLSARLLLIHLYIEGIGININMPEAEEWMLKVSSQMHQINDQDKIILFKRDFEEIKENIKKHINNNALLGVNEGILGYMYLRGWGTDKSNDKAFFHLNTAVELGNIFSMVDLGKMYQEGMGTKQDYLKAYHLYQAAADKGISAAYYRLGFMYEKGIGIEKDINKAEECFAKSQFMIDKNIKKNNADLSKKPIRYDEKKWKIGGKIHFEEKSSSDYLGTIEINKLTRESLKDFFDIKIDSCDHNAKALIKKEDDNYILSHYEERSSSGHGEEMHATLLYTSKRVDNGHETLKDVYQNLKNIDGNLPNDRIPTVEEAAQAYNKIIKPDWKFEISDIVFVKGKTGSCIIAKLLCDGRDEIVNKQGQPISGNFLHMSLVNIDKSIDFKDKKIDLIVNKLKEHLVGKKIKIDNKNGLADLEFGITGSKPQDRIRPTNNTLNYVKLDIPYIAQNDNYSCATTSLAMAISYYEKLNDKPLDKEFVWKLSNTDEKDVCKYGNDMEGLKNIANYYGYRSEYKEKMEIADVEELLSQGALVILNFQVDNKSSATHAQLVTGYNKNKKIFYINDPANIQNQVLEYSDLQTRWNANLSSPRGQSHRSCFIIYPKNKEDYL